MSSKGESPLSRAVVDMRLNEIEALIQRALDIGKPPLRDIG